MIHRLLSILLTLVVAMGWQVSAYANITYAVHTSHIPHNPPPPDSDNEIHSQPLIVPKVGSADEAILIICAYNPDVRTMSDNITQFMAEYSRLGGANQIIIEDISVRNFPESREWLGRMVEILEKYDEPHEQKISMVVTLGVEASAAFIDCPIPGVLKNCPVIGYFNKRMAMLPTEDDDLTTFKPQLYDIQEVAEKNNIVGGVCYDYSLRYNVQLIRRFFPEVSHLVALTDNTFGGVNMRAIIEEHVNDHKDFSFTFIDGRQYSFVEAAKIFKMLNPANSAVIVGTWRIDKNDSYVLSTTLSTMYESNPDLPAISMSTVGLGQWTVGAYSPNFQTQGTELAQICIRYQKTGIPEKISVVKNHYTFDYNMLKKFGIPNKLVPKSATIINKPASILEEHPILFTAIGVVALVMFVSFVVSLYYIMRLREMHGRLEHQAEQLIAARDEAQEANRVKSTFLANMSHEVRTPLNAIVGFSELLTDNHETMSTEECGELCNVIRNNTSMLLLLMNDIIDLTNIESNNMHFRFQPTVVAEVCHVALQSVEGPHKQSAKVKCVLNVPDDYMLCTDAQRLKQVLVNLITNAFKNTEEGTITLALTEDRLRHEVIFTVTDTGIGIPADKANVIFNRFVKLNEFAQGTGLGLSICKTIVEKLGGRIWLDTAYSNGAKFCFTHPTNIPPSDGKDL